MCRYVLCFFFKRSSTLDTRAGFFYFQIPYHHQQTDMKNTSAKPLSLSSTPNHFFFRWRLDVNYSARSSDGRVNFDALPSGGGKYCGVRASCYTCISTCTVAVTCPWSGSYFYIPQLPAIIAVAAATPTAVAAFAAVTTFLLKPPSSSPSSLFPLSFSTFSTDQNPRRCSCCGPTIRWPNPTAIPKTCVTRSKSICPSFPA